nr:unnamed protein product [Callosobruchus analis]
MASRGTIPGYDLIGSTYHRSYGVATYVRQDIENAAIVETSINNNIHEVAIKVGDITIANIYKPPAATWPQQVLRTLPHPAVYIGDFNSHHELWKYHTSDNNGESLVGWAEEKNVEIVFDAKDRNTFRSAAWNTETNPDLCFVSTNNNKPLPTSRKVLNDFPHSQHRPILVEIGASVPIIRSFLRPRWNFGRANWHLFAEKLDKRLGWIAPKYKNYKRFIGAVISSAKEAIPRGYRKEYVPGWNEHSEQLYNEFVESGDREVGDELLHSLDASRRSKWEDTVQHIDFTRSSRKAWSLLRKLGGGNQIQRESAPLHPNVVAHQIVKTSRAVSDKPHTRIVKQELKALKSTTNQSSTYVQPVTIAECEKALKEMKPGKAPGFDGIHSEFLLHSGKYAKNSPPPIEKSQNNRYPEARKT